MIESDTAATRGRVSNRFRGFSEASRPPSLRPLLGDRLLERRWAGIAPARLPSPIGPPRTQSLARAPPFVARSALTASHRAFNSQETFALSASRATCWTSCINPRPQLARLKSFSASTALIPSDQPRSALCDVQSFRATPLVRAYWERVCDSRMRAK